jgi:hypothetical protein
MKNKDKYLHTYYENLAASEKQRLRPCQFEDVDAALFAWLKQIRSHNVTINGPLLMTKAEELAKSLGHSEWKCNVAWLDRFKKRHDIVFKAVCGESAAVDAFQCDEWIVKKLPALLSGHDENDIFNADETGLFWRMMPTKTLCLKGEKEGQRSTDGSCGSEYEWQREAPLVGYWKVRSSALFQEDEKATCRIYRQQESMDGIVTL